MYIFLDESGDLEFDFAKQSTPYFVITLLICENKQAVYSFSSAVKHTIKRKLNKITTTELKSTQTLFPVKKYFFDNLSSHHNQDWYINSIILDKKDSGNKRSFISDSHWLYNSLSSIILQQVNFSEKNNDPIYLIVDRSKEKKERMLFNQYLRTSVEFLSKSGKAFRIEHEQSHNSSGLQAADLFCAGFSRKYAYHDTEWYDLFKHKINVEILLNLESINKKDGARYVGLFPKLSPQIAGNTKGT
jgi:hypothetical protein